MTGEATRQDPPDAEEIVRLRGDAPRVVRLSRKAIGIASAVALTLVGGALIYALQPPGMAEREELQNTDGIAIADGLAAAPEDYSQIPELGPALPGDLGKPILDAEDRGAVATLPPVGEPQPSSSQSITPEEAARLRTVEEREAARSSRLFFGGGTQPASLAGPIDTVGSPPAVPAPPGRQAPVGQFAEHPTASPQRLAAVPSSRVLQAGSVIPAALITGIRSDRPGLVTAHVTENVYDSPTGRILLIPQGSRLIGEYETDVGFGQRRVQLFWSRLILPEGRSIVLERQPAADPSGYAGLEDRVDYHWGGVIKAALVSTLLGIGGELGSGSEGELARALRQGSQDSVNRTGEQIVSRELAVRPTLTIAPGFPVRVLVTRDIVLEEGA